MVKTEAIRLRTAGHTDIHDITPQVRRCVEASGLRDGQATIFVPGSTAGLTTVEFEPGLVKDLRSTFEQLAPEGADYAHHATWGDDNGSAHVRAALIGPSLTVPFLGGRLTLGTWQQIVLIHLDTRPRERELVVQMLGE